VEGKAMDKKELLKKIGFSEEYLEALDRFERSVGGVVKSKDTFYDTRFKGNTSDTSELHVNTIIHHSSSILKIK
jgi:hypothetical protein